MPRRSPTVLLFLVASCQSCTGGSSNDTGSSTGASTTAESSDTGCPQGYEGCPCVDVDDGVCLAGLSCIAGTCEPTPASSSDDGKPTTSSTGTSDSEGGTPPPPCDTAENCQPTEVCFMGDCGSTDNYWFDVRVIAFEPNCADDFWSDSDLYFNYFEDGEFRSTSPTSSCPGAWPSFNLCYDSLKTFELQFWDADVFGDQYKFSFCWRDDANECIPIPPERLHDGAASDMTTPGNYFYSLTFTLRDGPCQ